MNSFPTFLYERRKALGLTQQNIADELGVTNKAVSKWEAGECFPETAQLMGLADILQCSVDELLRGRFREDKERKDRDSAQAIACAVAEMTGERTKDDTNRTAAENANEKITDNNEKAFFENKNENTEESFNENMGNEINKQSVSRPLRIWQGVCIAVGCMLIIFGVVALLIVQALGGATEENQLRGAAIMFAFLSLAVFVFVFVGVSHGVTDVVEERKKTQARLCAVGMGIGVAVIVASIIAVLLLPELLGVAVMLFVIALGVGMIVSAGIGISRFHLTEEKKEQQDPWSGVIMLTATAVFLLCGFLWGKWHPAWVVFPIGGILCGIVEAIRKNFKK